MRFRVLQWNCMYSEDFGKIAAFIDEIDADVICLQELTQDYHKEWADTGEFLAGYLQSNGHYAYGPLWSYPTADRQK